VLESSQRTAPVLGDPRRPLAPFTLAGRLPESDFPDLAGRRDMTHKFHAGRRPDLKRLIDKTQFAISTEETRYYLNGISTCMSQARGNRRRCGRRSRPTVIGLAQTDLAFAGRARSGMPGGPSLPRKDRHRSSAPDRGQRTSEGLRSSWSSAKEIRFLDRPALVLTSKADRRHLSRTIRRVIPSGNDKETGDRQEGLRGRGRPRPSTVFERAAGPRRQAVTVQRQADPVGDQIRILRQRNGKRSKLSTIGRTRSISASTRAIPCSTFASQLDGGGRSASSSPIPG